MSNITVVYRASQNLQKQLALENKDAREIQIVEVEATSQLMEFATVTPDGTAQINLAGERQWIHQRYAIFGRSDVDFTPLIQKKVPKILEDDDGWFESNVKKQKAVIKESKEHFVFDQVPTAESLVSELQKEPPDLRYALAAKQAEFDSDFEARKAAYLRDKEEQEARRAEEDAKHRAEDEKLRLEKEKSAKERSEWIAKNGSERLKLMLENGYELKLTYEQERAEIDFPGFEFDSDEFEYKRRANPSLDALRLLEQFKEHGPKIVLVESDDDDDESYEAIVISPAWCRTNLLRAV